MGARKPRGSFSFNFSLLFDSQRDKVQSASPVLCLATFQDLVKIILGDETVHSTPGLWHGPVVRELPPTPGQDPWKQSKLMLCLEAAASSSLSITPALEGPQPSLKQLVISSPGSLPNLSIWKRNNSLGLLPQSWQRWQRRGNGWRAGTLHLNK